MELRHLRYFTAVAKNLSFSKAAEELHISQPPLSRQIQELERELGTSLFDRKSKRIELTKAGEYMKDKAQRILDSVELMARNAKAIGEAQTRSLRIGCVSFLMYSALPPFFELMREREPGIRLDIANLATEAQEKAIRSGSLDIGFIRSWQRDERLVFEPLAAEHLAVIHPSSFAAGGDPRRCIERLASSSFIAISRESGPVLSSKIKAVCDEYGCSLNIGYVCSDAYSVIKLVGAGLGWSIIPALDYRDAALSGVGIVTLPQTVGIGLCYEREGLSETGKRFVELAKVYFTKSSFSGEACKGEPRLRC
jgi:DNA-binding transcriptional LysR family regulator